jgi:hypothetical protein
MRPFLLLALLLPALASAAPESRLVHCRFLLFGSEDSASSDKGGEITHQISNINLSEPTDCSATDNKILFLSGDHKPAGAAVIPATVSTALLVFVKVPSNDPAAPPWRIMAIEDSPKNFPDGGAFVANFYNKDIRFIIGEHKGMLHPAGNHGYALPAQLDSFNMAPVKFEFQQEDQWRTASESSLRFLPGMRYLIFAYVDPSSGRPRINTIQDIARPVPKAAKP